MDVVAWLRGLGLEQYAPAFRDNDVDGEVLPELTADDLISMGVTSVGHRRKLLAAIAALRSDAPPVAARIAPAAAVSADAERRQLTVMFCGLVGETPNLAARLQGLAQPGTLVIAESIRRQIGALFELEDLGPQPLAGFAEPQHAWRVTDESGVLSRFEALRLEATPLVGRDEE